MRLVRYRSASDGHVHVGVVVDGDGSDRGSGDELVASMGSGVGPEGQALLLALAMRRDIGSMDCGEPEPLAEVTLLAPIPEPPSIRDFYAFEAHVATARRSRGLEMEPDWYDLPVFYFTNPAAVLGPGDAVRPPDTGELDYELEVAAVIGVECADLAPDDWLHVVAGFTVMNDWSARDLQRREMALGLGPATGKDFATSLGPVLVTPDELLGSDGIPRGAMTASVNGVEWSRGELADLHFGWGDLLAQASRSTRLRPGDVIGSGTVGTGCILELGLVHGRERYPWLQPGDEVTLAVEGIGALVNRIASLGSDPDAPPSDRLRPVEDPLLQSSPHGRLAQLVRAPARHAGGRGFVSPIAHPCVAKARGPRGPLAALRSFPASGRRLGVPILAVLRLRALEALARHGVLQLGGCHGQPRSRTGTGRASWWSQPRRGADG